MTSPDSLTCSKLELGAGGEIPRRPGRTMALLDMENLVGEPLPSAEACDRVQLFVRSIWDGAQFPVVAACSHLAAKTAAFSWPEARWKFRSGKDGADFALIEELTPGYVARRFTHIILGSGDGIFSEHVDALVAVGVAVTVLSRKAALSNKLQQAATNWILIDDPMTASKTSNVQGLFARSTAVPDALTYRNEIPLSA